MNEIVETTFLEWVSKTALPLWSTHGLDHVQGGFFERMMPDGTMTADPRRARLAGRQIYVFATAEALGWEQDYSRTIVRHGLEWLFSNHFSIDDIVIPVVDSSGMAIRSGFDLYDQAFVLFGLAAAASIGEDTGKLHARARILRERMLGGWRHPVAGFEEANPRTLPLKANPHMHMLEASLAWEAISDDQEWRVLADEIVELCLSRFLCAPHGALHEFFDGDWRPILDHPDDVVEPGHQAEWAWLLIRWGKSRNRPEAIAAAKQLIAIAEGPGKDFRYNLYFNELGPDLAVRDPHMRLWPQTERVKALIALITISDDVDERSKIESQLQEAVSGLLKFSYHPIAGSWWEHIDPDGKPVHEPARASSLYHIMCAANELQRYLASRVSWQLD